MNKNPWFKFFPSDYRADTALRCCSIAARGIWMEMLCIMHEAIPYGHLVINGSAVSDSMLAILTGIDESTVQTLKSELKNANVFSISSKGTIFSRRMIRDEQKRKKLRKNGKKGGNPNLCNKKEKRGLDNQKLNQSDKPTETRSHIPDKVVVDTREQTSQHVKLGMKIAAIAGWSNDPNWFGNYSRIEVWLKNGWCAERDILPTVTRVMAKRSTPPKTLNYFEQAIADAHTYRKSPLKKGNTNEITERNHNGCYSSPASKDVVDRTKQAQRKALARFGIT